MTTKSQRERFRLFQHIGCVACRKEGRWNFADVHHLLSGNKRRGHDATIPLCPWHHRGEPAVYVPVREMETLAGPSLARTSRKFRERYGTDDDLLSYTNKLLEGARLHPESC